MNRLAKLIYDDATGLIDRIDFSELNGKTILITGATGLVGTYLAACLKRLSDAGQIKFSLIVVGHGKPDKYYYNLLARDTQLINGDLTEKNFLDKLPKSDYIIHAAGYGQPGRFLEDPVKTLKLNTVTTFSLLEKLKPGGKFLFISSSEIYSGSDKIPYREEDIGLTNTTHKRACYIEGKRSGEAISMAFRSKGLKVKAARLSLAYGPGTRKGDQRVLNSFIAKALNGEINLMDAGTAKRTYCYITDAVEMIWNILLFGQDFVYNVGGESKTTIADLARKIGDYMNVSVKIPEMTQTLTGAPDDVWLDLTKIKQEFNKTNFVGLDDGLAFTIEWQKILYQELPTLPSWE